MRGLVSLLQAECERCGAPALGRYRYYTPLRPDGEPVPPVRRHPAERGAVIIPCGTPGCDGFAVRRVGRRAG